MFQVKCLVCLVNWQAFEWSVSQAGRSRPLIEN